MQSCDLTIFVKQNPARKNKQTNKQTKKKKTVRFPFQIIILNQVFGEDIFDYNCDYQLLNTDLNNV